MFSFSVQLFYMILANEKYLFLQIYFFIKFNLFL